MPENTEVAPNPAFAPLQLSGQELAAALESERRLLILYVVAIYEGLQDERVERQIRWLTSFWPVAAGLLLGAFAPALKTFVAVPAPWAVAAVFPFLILAGRPEVGALGEFGRALPLAMLYGQFALDGLFARWFLSRRVTVAGVCGQVFCFHALGVLQLWLLNGGLNRLLAG